eukprot:TRINITY_DN4599_c0_g1_i9.p1 TRINITY_DN4599_c0_g1~~TRINITY_DN4599_c0_g1_i9.p1  ORF type:complete len:551 (-),score=207.49 TRINITY_DN4599_c0_g1_i9:60-1691(-)
MIRRPPRSTPLYSSAASDVYKRQVHGLVYLATRMNSYLGEVKKNKNFDPYDVLGVSTDASEREIKQAYRKLTVVMHPDKNQDDPAAAEKFMKLNNAYRSLTDPEARENFLKYGNPDGPTHFSIGIPLPSFMSKGENGVMTLIILFVMVLVVIPGFGYCLYLSLYRSNKYEILSSNEKEFEAAIKSNNKLKEKDVPEIVAAAREFTIYMKPNLEPECENIGKELGVKTKDSFCYKPLVLLQAFVRKIPIHNAQMLQDQNFVVKTSARVLSYLADLASKSPVIVEVLKFSQKFYQQLKVNDSPLMQLPHMTKEAISKLDASRTTFRDFISRSPQDRNLTSLFNESQAKDIEAAIAALPKLALEVTCGVEGSEGVYEGDILTLKIKGTIVRSNSDEADYVEEAPSAAHTNAFPQAKQEILWVIVSSEMSAEKCSSFRISRRAKNFTKSMNIFAVETGRMTFTVHAVFDCYQGLDATESVSVYVRRAAKRRVKDYSEDPELNEPSLVENIMESIRGKTADEEAELVEEEGEKKKGKKHKGKKKDKAE